MSSNSKWHGQHRSLQCDWFGRSLDGPDGHRRREHPNHGIAEESMMGSEHTTKAFDSDLQELTRLVPEMGGLAERMITDSVDALVRRDVALGQRVVAADTEIDNLQRSIEERAVL